MFSQLVERFYFCKCVIEKATYLADLSILLCCLPAAGYYSFFLSSKTELGSVFLSALTPL